MLYSFQMFSLSCFIQDDRLEEEKKQSTLKIYVKIAPKPLKKCDSKSTN